MKTRILTIVLLFFATCFAQGRQQQRLQIGVSLHPYYSFARNIVGDRADVIPMISPNVNPHGYRIIPEDIERAMGLDVVILNGVGHDEFALQILRAAGNLNRIHKIFANDGVALIPQSINTNQVNSHTFISISASIQQVFTIATRLAEIDPANAQFFRQNAQRYARQLRQLRAEFMEKLADYKEQDFRCATIHGGYSYLLQEFGFQVEAVIEPSHGVNPTASQMMETIEKIKAANVEVVFSESDFPPTFLRTIQEETGVRVVALSHLSYGEYSAEFFERGMRFNLEQLLKAVSGRD
jgi:zinc transport system substrate-binding protein